RGAGAELLAPTREADGARARGPGRSDDAPRRVPHDGETGRERRYGAVCGGVRPGCEMGDAGCVVTHPASRIPHHELDHLQVSVSIPPPMTYAIFSIGIRPFRAAPSVTTDAPK